MMYKKIELKDSTLDYALDEIDCFQKPITIALNSLDETMSDIFVMYAKTLEIYSYYSMSMIRNELLNILDSIGLVKRKKKKVDIIKYICDEIDKNNLLIIGLDYFEIFYSEYFRRESYPHWVIANGYDKYAKITSIIDYTQHMNLNYEYSNFHILNKLIYDANKLYRKNYGIQDDCFSINTCNNINVLQHIKTFLEFMISQLSKQELSTIFWLDIMKKAVEEDVEPIQTHIININKSRKVFFHKLIKIMYYLEYDKGEISAFGDGSQILIKQYINLTNINLIHFDNNTVEFIESIKIHEKLVFDKIIKFNQFVNLKMEIDGKRNNRIVRKRILNDDDGIVHVNDGVYFNFYKAKDYNWWEIDHAPKYELDILGNDETIEIQADIEIDNSKECDSFQVGFYIKSNKEAYFAGIGFNNICCIDNINKDNYSCYLEYKPMQSIYLKISHNFIEIGNCVGKIRNKILKRYYVRRNKVSVGLVCKKWGGYGNLCIKFCNVECSSNKIKM